MHMILFDVALQHRLRRQLCSSSLVAFSWVHAARRTPKTNHPPVSTVSIHSAARRVSHVRYRVSCMCRFVPCGLMIVSEIPLEPLVVTRCPGREEVSFGRTSPIISSRSIPWISLSHVSFYGVGVQSCSCGKHSLGGVYLFFHPPES